MVSVTKAMINRLRHNLFVWALVSISKDKAKLPRGEIQSESVKSLFLSEFEYIHNKENDRL
jgi:hypothetical protein